MSTLLALPLYRLTDANGVIIPNGRLYTFLTGTTTAAATYTTSALNVSHGAYVQANSAGLLPAIYLDPAVTYRFQVRASPYASAVSGMDFDPVTAATASDLTFGETTLDKLLPISVLAYGAVGDGTTDDSAAIQAAYDYLEANGGTLIFDPGYIFMMTSQATLAPTILKNIRIIGYGAELKTTGAISALKISGAEFFPHQVVVEGVKVNHRGNATATAGFELIHSSNVTLANCTVEAHGTGASYAAVLLQQSDTADEDTGCLWCTIDNLTVRPRSGVDGAITYGVRSIGYNNALTIRGGAITATTGVSLVTAGTAEFLANGVTIDDVKFEGGTTAISIVGKTGAFASISGLRITKCRAEALTNFLSLTGSTNQPVVPLFLAGNYLTPDVTNYIVNTNSLRVFSLDGSTNSPNAPETYFGGTWLMRNTSGSGSTLDLEATGAGIAVQRWLSDAAAVIATLRWDSAGLASLFGSGAGSLRLNGIGGISQTTTNAVNLRGTVTLSSGTAAVTFATAEPDTSYFIVLGGSAGESFSWASKATGGFTINSSNGSSTAVVNWMLIR